MDEGNGKIGYKIKSVTVAGGLRCIRIRGIASTLEPLDTNEWQIIINALAAGKEVKGQERRGFTYSLPLILS